MWMLMLMLVCMAVVGLSKYADFNFLAAWLEVLWWIPKTLTPAVRSRRPPGAVTPACREARPPGRSGPGATRFQLGSPRALPAFCVTAATRPFLLFFFFFSSFFSPPAGLQSLVVGLVRNTSPSSLRRIRGPVVDIPHPTNPRDAITHHLSEVSTVDA